MDVTERKTCRVCGGELADVFDFGNQCLGGKFPRGPATVASNIRYNVHDQIRDGDPPRFPLVLARCATGCGLIQLRHTVNPKLMFGDDYGYRSGVTETMRRHLAGIAKEAMAGLTVIPEGSRTRRILDIGGNDGTLVSFFKHPWLESCVIDPSDSPPREFGHIKGFFPQDMPKDCYRYDLIFSIACFYDSDDPVAFARAARDNLADDGVRCCEVADARWLRRGSWDSVCHEHLCYYTAETFRAVCRKADLWCQGFTFNECNGGSIRFWVSKREQLGFVDFPLDMDCVGVARMIHDCRDAIWTFLEKACVKRHTVHLLGASTKANTWLQYCSIGPELIQAASDRDPRKHGRRTPGTNIPIISEEHSRQLKPDVYIVGPWHFRDEIVEREAEFLKRGGKLVFTLPKLEVVG